MPSFEVLDTEPHKRKKKATPKNGLNVLSLMVGRRGVEPRTYGLRVEVLGETSAIAKAKENTVFAVNSECLPGAVVEPISVRFASVTQL